MWENTCEIHGNYDAVECNTPCPQCGQMPLTIHFVAGKK